MENNTNKIYARLNESKIVIELFSSVFEQPLETDILVEEGNEEYHAHVHLKYNLMDDKYRYNYKYLENKIVELTEEEKANLFPIQEEQPTEMEQLIDNLILDNLSMQSQIDDLILSSLGGN